MRALWHEEPLTTDCDHWRQRQTKYSRQVTWSKHDKTSGLSQLARHSSSMQILFWSSKWFLTFFVFYRWLSTEPLSASSSVLHRSFSDRLHVVFLFLFNDISSRGLIIFSNRRKTSTLSLLNERRLEVPDF